VSKKATVFDAFVNRFMRISNRSERRSSPLALLVCPSRSFQFAWFGLRKILVKVKPNPEKVEKYLFDRVLRL